MIRSFFEDLRRHKAYQERRNLPIRIISEETGLSQGAILRLKNGNFARVSLSTLERLCQYFQVQSLSNLIEYIPDEKQVNTTTELKTDQPAQ
jgi:DNA-binding Xre family transcriptional regulator